MSTLLPLAWFVGTIAGIWFIIAPKKNWPLVANRKRAAGFLAAFFLGMPLVAVIAGSGHTSNSTPTVGTLAPSNSVPTTSNVATDAPAAKPKPDQPNETPSSWTYDESKDEMRGTSTKYARVEGNEAFSNAFHMGDQKTQLEVQKRARGYEVALSNSNLQFTCNNFSGTHMQVKFDNGPVTRYGCTDAKGDTFGVAFLTSGARFVAALHRAKKVTIEAEIFQRGDVQMTFDVAGFNL